MAGSRLFLHGSQQTPLPPASRKNSDSPVSHSSSWVGISGTKANHPQDERHEEGVEAAVVAAFFGWYCQALFYISVVAGVKPKITVRERCDGARARPNPSYPLPLGHCWDG